MIKQGPKRQLPACGYRFLEVKTFSVSEIFFSSKNDVIVTLIKSKTNVFIAKSSRCTGEQYDIDHLLNASERKRCDVIPKNVVQVPFASELHKTSTTSTFVR